MCSPPAVLSSSYNHISTRNCELCRLAKQAALYYEECSRLLSSAPLNQHFDKSWQAHALVGAAAASALSASSPSDAASAAGEAASRSALRQEQAGAHGGGCMMP